jgi:hypothetical protein
MPSDFLYAECRECGGLYITPVKGLMPFHSYPPPTRRVCSGSKKPPAGFIPETSSDHLRWGDFVG